MEFITHINETDTKEIVSVIESFQDKWNQKDPQQFGEVFSTDAEFTDIVGQVALGRDAIIKQHKFPFENVQRLAVLTINYLYLRSVSDGLVFVTSNWTTEHSMTPKGDPLPTRSGILQFLFKKEHDIWKICLVHNTDVNQTYKAATNEKLKFIEA